MSRSDLPAVPRGDLTPGYTVPRIINGGWQLADGHRPAVVDRGVALHEMQRLVDAGLTAFDCGDIYLGVESLLGELRKTSDRVRIHTKYVPDRDDLPILDRRHVEEAVDRSLSRLNVERLDLLQFAWWDYAVPRYVEAALWLDEQRRAGKIGLLGVTNFDVPHLAEIVEAGVPLVAHQVQYSLLDRRPERGMVRFCSKHDIRLLAYGSLGGGFMSERYLRQPEPGSPLPNRSLVKYKLMIDELGGWERFQALLDVLDQIANRHNVSIANVAVRWVLDQPGVAAALVGAFDSRHLEDNLRVFGFELDDEDMKELERFEGAGPTGDVYAAERVRDGRHAAIMKYNLNRDSSD